MFPQIKDIALLYQIVILCNIQMVELGKELERIFVSHDFNIGKTPDQLLYICAMVRFHMVHHQIVQFPSTEGVGYILEELGCNCGVHSIKQCCLCIFEQV